jgi:histone-lysine N-methyltransferase SETMAR
MLRILQEQETNDSDGIAIGKGSWFQHITASWKMFAHSAANVISRTRQAAGAKQTVITVFFTAKKPIVLDFLPRGIAFNQLFVINIIFPDLKKASLNFWRQERGSTFWVHMDNSTCHNGSKVTSKIKKNHIYRMMHPPYSSDISPCGFWLFGMLKQILRDREVSSNDEIEDAIAQVWNDLTFDDVQSMFRDWIPRLVWVAENDGEYISE